MAVKNQSPHLFGSAQSKEEVLREALDAVLEVKGNIEPVDEMTETLSRGVDGCVNTVETMQQATRDSDKAKAEETAPASETVRTGPKQIAR